MNPPDTDRLPPHSVESEAAVLGCILAGPDTSAAALSEAMDIFHGARPEVFYDPAHQAIFAAMVTVGENGASFDTLAVMEKLRDRGQLDQVGGMSALAELGNNVASSYEVGPRAQVVYAKYLRRRGIQLCAQWIADAYDAENEDDLFASLERQVLALGAERVGEADVHTLKGLMPAVVDQMENYHRSNTQLRGLPTGFAYLDNVLCGLGPGQVIVIGARPGIGKTSLGMNIIEYIGVDCRIPCAVFSAEMDAEELAMRLPFQRTGGDYQRARQGFRVDSDLVPILKEMPALASAPVWIVDRGGISIQEIRSIARRLVRQHGVKTLLVDYAQLVTNRNKCRSREEEVADISRQMKAMAKELGIPVIVLAQLNREVEKRGSTKPTLSSLRESGSIEQDADVVILLYKVDDDEVDESQGTQAERDFSRVYSKVNALVAKQRNGPTGDVNLIFEKACMRFLSWNEKTQTMSSRRKTGAEYMEEVRNADNAEHIKTEDLPSDEELGLR
jgi:replicative DNA helicase